MNREKGKKRRKLNLRRATVRTLSGPELQRVAGGYLKEGTMDDSPEHDVSDGCPERRTGDCQAAFTGDCRWR
jgi:hypothetical protein